MKVAFISGTSLVYSQWFTGWEKRTVMTKFGDVVYQTQGDFLLLNRHGKTGVTPPHKINYRANFRALADLGYQDVVTFNSVGSLRKDLPPGSLVSCSDYIELQRGPETYHDDELVATTPGIANNLIPLIKAKLAPELEIITGQIYAHTCGPRFETPAEIRVLAQWGGDVVGMTLAPEADLCAELGLRYNSLAMVDNYANGVAGATIGHDQFYAMVKANQEKTDRVWARLLEILR